MLISEHQESAGERYPNDPELLDRVLRCYKPHCRYLRSMTCLAVAGLPRGLGELAIEESCYIDDTGHLNAVEVNIAYNQLLYHTIANAVAHRIGPVFSTWTMERYWARQLPDILIARMETSFLKPINPRSFSGEFRIDRALERRVRDAPLISLDTSFSFWDESGGKARGQARIAIVSGA